MTDHYFSEKPASLFKKEEFDINLLGYNIPIASGSGIFSLKSLDFGTELLIRNAQIPHKESKVLDLGCGYGIVGIMMKKLHPTATIMMSDVNERAVRLSKENCEKNNVECAVLKSDLFSHPNLHKEMFDVILTNPPFSAGKKLCLTIIDQSFEHLNKDGLLELVAPHNKGGESLKKHMLETFGNVGELAKKSGFRVYISIKK